VRAVVSDQLQRAGIVPAQELDSGVVGDRIGEVHDLAIEGHGDRALREGFGDALDDLATGDAGGMLALRAIGECQDDHSSFDLF
jgi:hypothetical protein